MSGDLKWNKILGAGLATALVVLALREISDRTFAVEQPKKAGYAVAVAQEAGGAGEPADTLPDWGSVVAKADVTAGQAVFAKCQSCHNNAPGGPNQIGPNLNGVVGRPIASHAGFAYSDAMKTEAQKDKNWTLDVLYQYLKAPTSYVPGTKMTFVGVKSPADRVNLIAYLRSMGSTGYPIPAPDPKRQPAAAAAPAGAAGTTSAPSTAAGQAPTPNAGNGGPAGQTPAAGAAGQPQTQTDVAGKSKSTGAGAEKKTG